VKLRAEIVDGGAALYDPLTRATIPVDEELRAAIAGGGGERARRRLWLLGIVDGAGDEARARLLRAHLSPPPVRTLDGARFACQGAGECCRSYQFGPLTDDDAARIQALPIAERLPHLAGQPLLRAISWTGERGTFHLATVDDRCVFQLPDARCALHATFGAEAKPDFCRLYPLQSLPTVDGIKLYDRGECASFATSAFRGPLLADEAERLRPLLRCAPVHHPPTEIARGLRCDYGYVLALSRALLDEIALLPSLRAPIAVARRIRAVADVMDNCPFDDGQLSKAVEDALALPSEKLPPAGDARAGRAILGELGDALAEADPIAPHRAHFKVAVRHLASAARGEARLDLDLADEPWRLSLRHTLFGRQFTVEDSLPAGVLAMTLAHVISRQLAHTLADPSFAHMIATRTLRRPRLTAAFTHHAHDYGAIAEAVSEMAETE